MQSSTDHASKKVRIGDVLLRAALISDDQLATAIEEQKKVGGRLGSVIVKLGYVSEQKLLKALAESLQIDYVDLHHYQFNRDIAILLPEIYARRFRAIVLEEQADRALLLGMVDPVDIVAYDELTRILKRPIKLAIVHEDALLESFDRVYHRSSEISGFAEALSDELVETDHDLAAITHSDDANDAPVVKLLQTLFEQAVAVRASDIHIEPGEKELRIRQRVDGVLHEQIFSEARVASALTLRLKLMAGLNIAEKRLPQDGRFNIKVKGKEIDVRLSTLPIQFGESVVLRLFDQSVGSYRLEEVGFPEGMTERMHQIIHHPYGMVLVTGPTGSGKTTTLYAALNELNSTERKIITAEDPVEFRLPRVNQVHVNTAVDLSFARVLRAALRQDPDIVMVGEIRDQETANIALKAAMTGHLVFATLHTNDAVSSALRLIDMGAEGYLVAASLQAVVAQRLVRKNCTTCIDSYQPDVHQLSWLKTLLGDELDASTFKKGRGCNRCHNTGYQGRVGVYELLEIDAAMANALRMSDSAAFNKAAGASELYRPLGFHALDLARQGITSLSEVVRVAGEIER